GVKNTNKRDWQFYPGEGIVSELTSSYIPPSGSGARIRYVGVASNGTVDDSPPYTGTALLTFNANTDTEGSAETGFLASVAVSPGSAKSAGAFSVARTAGNARHSPLPPIYPIDAGVLLRQRKAND
ncbi:MAG: hypothetical protein LBI85_06895, partial [Spirochaetaceae bacterium]|nr:hypothetical protein [Spirochaetaceae bacterium]